MNLITHYNNLPNIIQETGKEEINTKYSIIIIIKKVVRETRIASSKTWYVNLVDLD